MILGHLELAEGVHIGACTVVSRSIREAGEYAGFYPLQPKADWARTATLLRRLESMSERLRTLENRVGPRQADHGEQ
jgi:UDP-3-O-[3-hydroxymyristoyl] glucosamine N-acyltransferase